MNLQLQFRKPVAQYKEKALERLSDDSQLSKSDIQVWEAVAKGLTVKFPTLEPIGFSVEQVKYSEPLFKKWQLWRFIEYHAADTFMGMTLMPTSRDFSFVLPAKPEGSFWKVPQFLTINFEGAEILFRNPLSHCILRFGATAILQFVSQFISPMLWQNASYPDSLQGAGNEKALFLFLRLAGVLLECDAHGHLLAEEENGLAFWETKDMHMHAYTQLGRVPLPFGGYDFWKDKKKRPPSVKINPWASHSIQLPKPDMARLKETDVPLAAAMENRRSVRQYNSNEPITLEELAELLYRSVRISQFGTSRIHGGEMVYRPYPSCDGASPQEFYLVVNTCHGLESGVYYYDALNHALCFIVAPNKDSNALLRMAQYDDDSRPQVLIAIASRFQRVQWNTTGLAYAMQLKDVGGVYYVLSLVASAMNLGGCPLTFHSADRLARLTGESFWKEGAMGGFKLGRPMEPKPK